jgi:hypothetical protein
MKLLPQVPLAASDVPDAGNVDRRTPTDRRELPTDAWGALPPAGHRMVNRRTREHRQRYFVDRFSPAMFVVVLMLLTASIVDAILTIQLIQAGAEEINPVMDRLLDHGILAFVLGKYALTVTGLPLLLIFKNFYLFGTRFRVGYLIPAIVVLYGVLIGYQLLLMHRYAGW